MRAGTPVLRPAFAIQTKGQRRALTDRNIVGSGKSISRLRRFRSSTSFPASMVAASAEGAFARWDGSRQKSGRPLVRGGFGGRDR